MSTQLHPLLSWRAGIAKSDLPPTARHVALTLSLHMNELGGSAFPSAVRLAQETGLSDRCVRTQLHLLVERGWLVLVSEVVSKTRGREYRAVIPTRNEVPVSTPEPPSSPEGGSGLPLKEVPTNSSINSSTHTRVFDADFDDWWASWPRKVDKSEARAKYRARRKSGASHADLCKARDNYLATVDDVRYCKYGATFLAPETWTEWLNPPPRPTNGHVKADELAW